MDQALTKGWTGILTKFVRCLAGVQIDKLDAKSMAKGGKVPIWRKRSGAANVFGGKDIPKKPAGLPHACTGLQSRTAW
jgi:hypothetical protein